MNTTFLSTERGRAIWASNCVQSRYRAIRFRLLIFIMALVLSGLTAIPVQQELRWLSQVNGIFPTSIEDWLHKVLTALDYNTQHAPFLQYAFDWLAFAHVIIALFFIEAWRRPLDSEGILRCGLIASLAVLPFALLFGEWRAIPLPWRLGDCSFGIISLVLLLDIRRRIRDLKTVLESSDDSFSFS